MLVTEIDVNRLKITSMLACIMVNTILSSRCIRNLLLQSFGKISAKKEIDRISKLTGGKKA